MGGPRSLSSAIYSLHSGRAKMSRLDEGTLAGGWSERRWLWRTPAAVVLTLLVGLFGGCDGGRGVTNGGEDSPRLNVLLISIDTTRADHLACYGHPSVETPNIDRLATGGTLFLHCTSAVPITLPSHSSMMTGTYPFVHGARDNGTFHLHGDNVTLAEILREAGYATGAEVATDVLNREYGLAQGFDTYRDAESLPLDGEARERDVPYRRAEEVCDGALSWLRTHAGAPLFLFVHFFDPHDPYVPPARFASRYGDPYVGEIAYVDEQVGRLLAELDALGLAERTLVVLTSDHGEVAGNMEKIGTPASSTTPRCQCR